MTTYYLIRHGATDFIGRALSGRIAGVHLNELGRNQATRLAGHLKDVPLQALYSSPLERAMETAEPLARQFGFEVRINPAFHELDFGCWSGLAFPELEKDPAWHRFNRFRSSTRAPGGELMLEVQSRAVTELERLRLLHPDQTIAIVSHADVIRAVISHYAGVPLDLLQRFEVEPGSISVIAIDENGPQIRKMNC